MQGCWLGREKLISFPVYIVLNAPDSLAWLLNIVDINKHQQWTLPRHPLAHWLRACVVESFQPWLPGSMPPGTALPWQLVVDLSLAMLGKEGTWMTLGPFPSIGDTSLLPQPSFARLPCKCTSNIFGSTAFLQDDSGERLLQGYKNDKR